MLKKIALFLVLANCCLFVHGGNLWLEWDSPACSERLDARDPRVLNLLSHYECQCHPVYCGVASSVIALNVLSVKTAECSQIGSFRYFTQKGFVSKCVEKKLGKGSVERGGMSFNQLVSVLKTLPVKVNTYRARKMSDAELRRQLIGSLKNPRQVVLANFNRGELNQQGGGHWSPIAAYDAESDTFLVLDVARFKYPPFWASAKALFSGMRTTNCYGESRGFITIEKK